MKTILSNKRGDGLRTTSNAAIAVLLIAAVRVAPQESAQRTNPEMPDDEYVHVPRATRQTSRAYRFTSPAIFTAQVNVNEFGENFVADAANEPSLALDPTNPKRMVIGWRQFDTVNSNFRQAGYAFSADGGATWIFPGVIEPGIFRSDPVLDTDTEGNFYYNSLTTVGADYLCHVFKSRDRGMTWDAGTFAHGGDKQWMVIDKSESRGRNNIYAFWKQSFSVCAPGFFTRSFDRGARFENCVIIPAEEMIRGTLAVGPEGELYACGQINDGFVVAKSLNARDSSETVAWPHSARVDLDGTLGEREGPNPGGLLGQAWIAVDHSNGARRGNVYLLCSVKRFSISDPLDVMFAASTDGGVTWSAPVRINDDSTNSAWQWFGAMSVAPNGRLDVTWLDTRDDPNGFGSALYYSCSLDGGATWSANEKLSEVFDPHVGWPRQNKMGDYAHMISEDARVHLAWAATFNGEQDVYYSRITPKTSAVQERKRGFENVRSFAVAQNHPNPFNPSTTINYVLEKSAWVEIKILNALGEAVRILVREPRARGRHSVVWDGTNDRGEPVPSGIYFYSMTAGEQEVIAKRMLLLK